MKWRGRRQSSNVRMSGGKAAGGGIFGIIIGLILWLVFDMNPMTAMQTGNAVAGGGTGTQTQTLDANSDRDAQFVATVLADTEDIWQQIFAQQFGKSYREPQLEIFNGRTTSACGGATSATGPFYCPADQTIYLDTSFFAEMRQQLGIAGDQQGSGDAENRGKAGDFAQAYVIAHEVGHHVQTLLGISQEINVARRQVSKAKANELSVRQELQADCFAGVWANYNRQYLEAGDIDEALHAASQIGDDRLAHSHGQVAVPDNFTHGTSQQRVTWFSRGFQTGDIHSCDTFGSGI